MRVVIADDHALLRESLVGFLRGAFPTWEFGQAGSLDEAKARLAETSTNLLIIDLEMPGMQGSESLEPLRAENPEVKMAVLTATEDRSVILGCLAAGVHGYILKLDATDELLTAIRTIMDGGVYVPAALSRVIRSAGSTTPPTISRPRPPVTVPTLTARQQDVMTLLAEGLSTKMIARRLSLGVGTVKVHLAALYRALDVHTRMEAVVKAGALIEQK
jgi:DNA-binding NarL/FixJ family response regulator